MPRHVVLKALTENFVLKEKEQLLHASLITARQTRQTRPLSGWHDL